MRVAVTGGRAFSDRALLWESLCAARRWAHLDTLLVGDCPTGADRMARQWATFYRVKGVRYVAHWDREGKSAGPNRNRRMIEVGQPGLLIAFPGGSGTAHCISVQEKAGGAVCKMKSGNPIVGKMEIPP